ncbi:MAG: site-2 protease family protein [Proteobacteria bacterium]|nr:site-2 protease family protein [Pseudomonadota bacterium]
MEELTTVGRFAVWALPVLFAITLHEVAHGWVAKLLGDRTAERMGRLSLNPLRHIDPVGTLLVPGLLLVFSQFVFGWAKPVPVDWGKLRRPRRDVGLVAAAGPVANLLMTVLWILVAKLAILLNSGYVSRPMIFMAAAGIFINSALMLLNLLPIPPLDGGRILSSLLSPRWAMKFGAIEPYGFIILVLLIVTNALSMILSAPLNFMLGLALELGGIPPGILFHLFGRAS